MKKKILFVIDSLQTGGAEKSLVSLLNELDHSKYEVHLQMFSLSGQFLKFIPEEVQVLPEMGYFEFCRKPLFRGFRRINEIKYFISRIQYSIFIYLFRKSKHATKARYLWSVAGHQITSARIQSEVYDIAIAYSQNVPTFFVANNVKAHRKIAWYNALCLLGKKEVQYQQAFYENIDEVVVVTPPTQISLLSKFPKLKDKVCVIKDINSEILTRKIANLPISDRRMNFDGLKLLTTGRLAYGKGYDMAIDSALILKNKGVAFKWFFLGQGDLYSSLFNRVKELSLEDHICFLGSTENVYHYTSKADIYVQPSRYESYGLALLEARAMGIPCIATNFDSVGEQIVHKENGYITEMNPSSIANGILDLCTDQQLRLSILSNMKKEIFYNTTEIDKVHWLLDN